MRGVYNDDLSHLPPTERARDNHFRYGEWICNVDWQWTAGVDELVTLPGLSAREQSRRLITELRPGRATSRCLPRSRRSSHPQGQTRSRCCSSTLRR